MEQMTLGGFIAALRKENGMTQKQLAERLGVSDKAVSRWEREESAPDLSLIPQICDIFQITADELLRGRRHESAAPLENEITPKNHTSYQILTILSVGLILLGLMAACICRFAIGYRYGVLGYCLELVFFLAAGICQSVFAVSALSRQNLTETQRDSTARTWIHMMILLISLIFGTIPIMNSSLDGWELILTCGVIGVPLGSVLVMISWFWLYPRLAKSNNLFLKEAEQGKLRNLRMETIFWDLWILGLLALITLLYSAVAHSAYPMLIAGLMIGCMTIPISLIIYLIRKRKI